MAVRVQRFLDWATPETLGERGEVALVNDAFGGVGESIGDVVAESLGEPYVDQFSQYTTNEMRWIDARLGSGTLPPLILPDSNAHALTHAVFHASNFGSVPVQNAEAVARLTNALAATTDPELVAQYLLALQCLGETLPTDRYAELVAWYDEAWQPWPDQYHPRCVAALLFALEGD